MFESIIHKGAMRSLDEPSAHQAWCILFCPPILVSHITRIVQFDITFALVTEDDDAHSAPFEIA